MWNRISVGIAAMLATVVCGVAMAAAEYKIVTASEKGTYYAIGQDLSKHVAPAADINLEVLATSGSAANIKALRYDAGVKFAVVQADVYQAFIDRAAGGSTEAASIIRPLRVILPLYNTEIHYIVRAWSSDVCSSDLLASLRAGQADYRQVGRRGGGRRRPAGTADRQHEAGSAKIHQVAEI